MGDQMVKKCEDPFRKPFYDYKKQTFFVDAAARNRAEEARKKRRLQAIKDQVELSDRVERLYQEINRVK